MCRKVERHGQRKDRAAVTPPLEPPTHKEMWRGDARKRSTRDVRALLPTSELAVTSRRDAPTQEWRPAHPLNSLISRLSARLPMAVFSR